MQSTNHKKNHSYRVSYALEVGSSFDPDMEDPSTWESELHGKSKLGRLPFRVPLFALPDQKSNSTGPTPDDLEEAEFLEYAEKCAAIADFADLDLAADDSDIDDLLPDGPCQTQHTWQLSDMDVS